MNFRKIEHINAEICFCKNIVRNNFSQMDRLQMQIRNSNISVSFLLKVRDHPERVQKGKCKANSGKKKKKTFYAF